MSQEPIKLLVDDKTHERHLENLRQATEGLRALNAELALIEAELDRRYEDSPIGQFHARRRRGNGAPPVQE
ncbi:MAG: hypothetical protein KME03_04605 [Aphanocapsa lilacina HA4352-LM1]|jgi:hypothetical protein|nr:hypothetical protein [Aphanocapsa lilacina HA4352-LM1]